jgi:hypothetical protein
MTAHSLTISHGLDDVVAFTSRASSRGSPPSNDVFSVARATAAAAAAAAASSIGETTQGTGGTPTTAVALSDSRCDEEPRGSGVSRAARTMALAVLPSSTFAAARRETVKEHASRQGVSEDNWMCEMSTHA